MTVFLTGLLLFLATHSVRIFAEDWRTRQVARWGEIGWKARSAAVSIVGFVLMVWGYGATREAPIDVWNAPIWTRHLAALLTVPAFVLLVAAYLPGSRIKARLGHPMVLGVKLWAFAHLISNGRLGDLLLFGSFLAWAILDFRAAKQRDRRAGTRYPDGTLTGDIVVVVVGVAAWALFALYGHAWLIGVAPFG